MAIWDTLRKAGGEARPAGCGAVGLPLPLDLIFVNLVSAKELQKIPVVPDQHQFLKSAAGSIFKPRHLLAGADAGADDGDFPAAVIGNSFRLFPSAKHQERPAFIGWIPFMRPAARCRLKARPARRLFFLSIAHLHSQVEGYLRIGRCGQAVNGRPPCGRRGSGRRRKAGEKTRAGRNRLRFRPAEGGQCGAAAAGRRRGRGGL